MGDTEPDERSAGKHSPYFELRDALAKGGCPLCHVARRASTHYLDTLNYEGVNDPGLRQDLIEANGLCFRHAWEWTHMRGSAVGVALVYRNIVKHINDSVGGQKQVRAPGRNGTTGLVDRLAAHATCPACAREQAAAGSGADLLLQHFDDPEIEHLRQTASALCLAHFRLVLTKARGPEAAHLVQQQSAAYDRLLGELDEFIRKNDYRFANEPMGEERDSWTRAVATAVGEPPID